MTEQTEIELGGRVVVITGAGQGLGRAYALEAARAGARLVINDVDAVHLEDTAARVREHGAAVVTQIGAVQDPGCGDELVELAHAEYRGLDAIILNAGVMDVTAAVDCGPVQLRRALEINVLGTMLCGIPAMRNMMVRKTGSVVLVVSGARFGMSGLSAYGATKGAIASLTWSWAAEAAGSGVRVNALSPLAQTAMFALNPAVQGGPAPESIAPAAIFLVSQENDLHGEIIRFDGTTLAFYTNQGSSLGPERTRSIWSSRDVADAVSALRLVNG